MTVAQVRLEWLEVRGFRAFGSETRRMDMASSLIVIHAGNSQGKTSLAEAVEFLVTGRSSRRDLFGGAKAEYNASLRNAHLPVTAPVWVAAGIRDSDGVLHEVKRELVSDFSNAADCESRLIVDGLEASSLQLLGIETNEGAIAAPVLLQHTLRYVLSTEPKQRANYFKALLSLSDLDYLRERVRAQSIALDPLPPGSGLAAVRRLSQTKLAAVAATIQRLDGTQSKLRADVEQVLLHAGSNLLGQSYVDLADLRRALEQEAQERNDRVFPLTDFAGSATRSLPALPDLSEYSGEISRVDQIAAALLPVLSEILRVPEIADVNHPVDCPVCLTPKALTPERVAEISTQLRDTKQLAKAASAAEGAISDFRSQLRGWVKALKLVSPPAAAWDAVRESEVGALAAELGEDVPELLHAARRFAQSIALEVAQLAETIERLDTDAAEVAERVRRRAVAPSEGAIDLSTAAQQLSALRKLIAEDETLSRLRASVDPLLKTRLKAEGTQDLLQVLGLVDEIVDELDATLRRAAAQNRLGRAEKSLKRASSAVLDERFAMMSDSIARWWGSIRPEELVGFAGVKRRAAGAIFVNLVAALQADLQGAAVERDALGVFSDSQLNALGLSTFLARTELIGSPFVFLDDPIPGSDGDHRLTFVQNTLTELLASGRQVIITTYDPKLAELAQTINESWEPITYDLALLNVLEGTEPAQTSDQFSNYMLQGEDGINAPTAAGRRGACTAYRSAAERLAKQIIATNHTAAGTDTSVADVEKRALMLGELIPLVTPFTLSADEKGKWGVIPKVLNPGNHDDGAPSTIELKQIRGNLRQIAKAHKQKWGIAFIR